MKLAYGEVNDGMAVESKSVSGRIFDCFNILFLILLLVVTLYPFVYVLFASFSLPARFLKHDFVILLKPLGFLSACFPKCNDCPRFFQFRFLCRSWLRH